MGYPLPVKRRMLLDTPPLPTIGKRITVAVLNPPFRKEGAGGICLSIPFLYQHFESLTLTRTFIILA